MQIDTIKATHPRIGADPMEVPRYWAGIILVILIAYGSMAEQVAPINIILGIIRYGYPACFIIIVAIGARTNNTTNPETPTYTKTVESSVIDKITLFAPSFSVITLAMVSAHPESPINSPNTAPITSTNR